MGEVDQEHLRRVREWVESTDRIHARLRALPPEERRALLCPPVVARKRPEEPKKRRRDEGRAETLGLG